MQTGVLVEPFRRKRAKKNGPFGAVETVDKVVNLRDGKVGQPLAALPLYGCCIPLAGKGCARETQEGETGDAPPVEISATERKGVRGKPKKGFLRH